MEKTETRREVLYFTQERKTRGLADSQEAPPEAWCRYCRSEIYEGEEYFRVDGRAVCTACLDQLARDQFRLYRVEGGT